MNIWMSYFLTADKDVNMKAIFEATNTPCVVDSDSDSLDSDNDFRSGFRNVSHHYRQRSFSGLHSPRQSTTFLNVIFSSQISESEEMRRNLVFEKKAFRRLSRLIMPVKLKIIYKLTQA